MTIASGRRPRLTSASHALPSTTGVVVTVASLPVLRSSWCKHYTSGDGMRSHVESLGVRASFPSPQPTSGMVPSAFSRNRPDCVGTCHVSGSNRSWWHAGDTRPEAKCNP